MKQLPYQARMANRQIVVCHFPLWPSAVKPGLPWISAESATPDVLLVPDVRNRHSRSPVAESYSIYVQVAGILARPSQ
jgi:hypothetical protein